VLALFLPSTHTNSDRFCLGVSELDASKQDALNKLREAQRKVDGVQDEVIRAFGVPALRQLS
jgi:hypothetical protein